MNEAPHTNSPGRLGDVVGAAHVGVEEVLVFAPEAKVTGGMNHGLAALDQFQRGSRFARIAANQLDAALDQELSVAGRPHQTANLVAAFDQERNETVT